MYRLIIAMVEAVIILFAVFFLNSEEADNFFPKDDYNTWDPPV